MTIIAIVLPLLAALNAIYYQRIAKSVDVTTRRKVFGIALQILQAIVTTVLATLFFSNVVPSSFRRCILGTTWQHLFSTHDAESIRRIQDTLNCCGFNTVRDRAWPFQGHPPSERQCAEIYERTTPCFEPWRTALQRSSGWEFGVVLTVGIAQVGYSVTLQTRFWMYYSANGKMQIVTLIVAEILKSHSHKKPWARNSRYGATGDRERARLLPESDDEPDNAPEGPRLLPTGEPAQTDQTESSNGRGTDPPDGNPWQGE